RVSFPQTKEPGTVRPAVQFAPDLGGLAAQVLFPLRRPVTSPTVERADAGLRCTGGAQAVSVDAGPLLTMEADGALRTEAVFIETALAAAAGTEAASRHGQGSVVGGSSGAARASATAARASGYGCSSRSSVATSSCVSCRSRKLTASLSPWGR